MPDLSKIDRQNIWHPFTPLSGGDDPILISSASGVYLHTPDGRKILDAISSWWVNLHGHSNPEIAGALAKQALELEHVIFAGFTHEPAITLAKNLLSILPGNQSRIFFSDNGSTAVEVALKMAIQYWDNLGLAKREIIALDGAYHGDTFGSMSVGERSLFTQPFRNHLFDVGFVGFPSGTNERSIIDDFKNRIAGGNVAAFIFEPLVQGAAGMRIYNPSFLDELMAIAQANDVICIADEVLTGFGRTGRLFASEYLKCQPDIIALSKGITGGTMPLGATSCSGRVASAFMSEDFQKTFFHGHSYTANPLACAAANASFSLLMREECQTSIRDISASHVSFISRIKNHPRVLAARSLGTILAVELRSDENSSYANSLRKKIYSFFLSRNILLRPLGNVIYILPPYVISHQELETIYRAIAEFLDE